MLACSADVLKSDAYTLDYRGRPRSLKVASGLVTADNGRCSDMGMSSASETICPIDVPCSAWIPLAHALIWPCMHGL